MKRPLLILFMSLLTLSAAAGQPVWWGYWNSTIDAVPAMSCQGTNSFGLRLNAMNNARLAGTQAHGLRFCISDKSAVERAWAWVSVSKFSWGSTQPDVVLHEVDVTTLSDMQHDGRPAEILFPEPVALLGTGRYASVYVGFTLQVAGGGAPCQVLAAGPQQGTVAQSFLFNWESRESSVGPLAMQILVSSDALAGHGVAVVPAAEAETMLLAGEDYERSLTLRMDGTTPVESVDLQVLLNGVPQPVQHCQLPQPVAELDAAFTLPLQLSVPTAAEAYDCQVAVTGVNGQPNGSSSGSTRNTLIALSRQPLKRSVMEELTGTWCPNCPRGLVGMQLLEEQFADRFVGIAIHGGAADEPMRLPVYDGSQFVNGLGARMGGRPSCAIDRMAECDPFGGVASYNNYGADRVVEYALQQPTVADLAVSAQWQGDDVSIDVATTFRYSAAEAHHQLMLVITADSLEGEGSEWLQVNTLVGKTDYDSLLSEFINGERYMRLKYCHVPIWAEGVENGIEGSISAPLVADQPQHLLRTVPMADNALLQRRDLLHAVAMLIDVSSGHVVNVAKAHVGTGSSGIVTPSTQHLQAATQCFTPDGRRISHAPRGTLVIERRADGTVRKGLK